MKQGRLLFKRSETQVNEKAAKTPRAKAQREGKSTVGLRTERRSKTLSRDLVETIEVQEDGAPSKDPKQLRTMLSEAVEDHDLEGLCALIPYAEQYGVDSSCLQNARKIREFLESKSAWREQWKQPEQDGRLRRASTCPQDAEALRAQLLESRAQLDALQDEHLQLQQRLKEEQQQLQAALQERGQFQAQLEACKTERDMLREQLESMRTQLNGAPLEPKASPASPPPEVSPEVRKEEASPSIPKIDLEEIRFCEDLGAGAVGSVCRGTYLTGGKEQAVAVKRFGTAGIDACKLEQDCLAMLDHPNVVKLLGTMQHPDGPCLVIELLQPPNWQALDPPLAICQICRAVQHAHKQNVVHLDIKLDNIMQDPATGNLKLIDFSVGTPADQQSSGFLGSLPFAAPELLADEPWWGTTADIYSIGIVLAFLLNVQLLFQHMGWAVPMNNQLDSASARYETLPRLQDSVLALAKELAATAGTGGKVCRLMLAPEPSRRPSATEALELPWLDSVQVELRKTRKSVPRVGKRSVASSAPRKR